MAIQSLAELESWHVATDPWGYETNPDDRKRKEILLSEIPLRSYANVLDIGCGHGFVTRDLPGQKVLGVDISQEAIKKAQQTENERVTYRRLSLFECAELENNYDLVLITGVLYPQYIGNSLNLVYATIDKVLAESGVLVCVHIDQWYKARFPYLMLKEYFYDYREFTHRLEVYIK